MPKNDPKLSKAQSRRRQIVECLEGSRPERDTYDTLLLAKFVETGAGPMDDHGIQETPADETAHKLGDEMHSDKKKRPTLEQIISMVGPVIGPFKIPVNKEGQADPGEGIWCENCKKFHKLPDEDEIRAAVKQFFRDVVQPEDKIHGRDA